jgi:hypothetical protein
MRSFTRLLKCFVLEQCLLKTYLKYHKRPYTRHWMTRWTRLMTLKLCSVFLNRIYEVSTMCPNCVGSARHWCKNEQSFLSWWQKKCHIWLMPYATNFDGCCLINPAVMRQSCPSIRQKSEQKSSEEKKKSACQFFRFI